MNYLDIPDVNGVLTVTHVKTQSFYLVCAVSIRKAAIMVNGQLKLGTYQNPRLQELYSESTDLDYTFVETTNVEESRSVRQSIMAKHYGNEKLLNQQDWPKLIGVYKLTHIPTGKHVIGTTQDLIKQHGYQNMLLRNGKHKCSDLQALYDPTIGTKDFNFSFNICTDKEEAKIIANKWIEEAVAKGLYLTGTPVKPDKVEDIGKISGVYRIYFPNSGHFYIGSALKVRDRISSHNWALKNNRHKNSKMQDVYNKDSEYTVDINYTDTREEAYTLEQTLVNAHMSDPLFLNMVTDVKSTISDIWKRPGFRLATIERLKKHRKTTEQKLEYGEKMKAYWANPEARSKRMGAGNPFARAISMFGVTYGSVIEAIRAKKLSASIIRKRLKDPSDKDIYYLS